MHRERPLIAFFDSADVFEDFYPHYNVGQKEFATRWANAGCHAFLSIIQREIGEVTWYVSSLAPEIEATHHEVVGCQVKMLPSSTLHRWLWKAFYLPRAAWRWQTAYRAFATMASYLAPVSWPLLKSLRRDQPDFLFVEGYASGRFDVLLLAARLLGIPLIGWHAGGEPSEYLGGTIRRFTIPRADRLIVSGQDELEMLTHRYHVPPIRLSLILTPIDIDVYRPLDRTTACQLADLSKDRRYLLFVGRLDDTMKRIRSIIRCFAALTEQHSDADLLIVGEGLDSDELKQLAAEQAGRRIRFLGWVSEAETKAAFYNAAECLLLASRREGFPTVVGEAMACGTPVLSTQVGGVSELVTEEETGWLTPPGDDAAFQAKMAHVLANPAHVASLRPRVRAMAERRISPSAVATELRKCFVPRGARND